MQSRLLAAGRGWRDDGRRSRPFPRGFVGHGCDFEGEKRSSVVFGIPAKSKQKVKHLAAGQRSRRPEAPLLHRMMCSDLGCCCRCRGLPTATAPHRASDVPTETPSASASPPPARARAKGRKGMAMASCESGDGMARGETGIGGRGGWPRSRDLQTTIPTHLRTTSPPCEACPYIP